MRILTLLLASLFLMFECLAQSVSRMELVTRVDSRQQWADGRHDDDGSGFYGQYLRFRLDGTIAPNVKFVYRQRFDKENKDASYFDLVDFMKITFDHGEHLFLTLGKDDVQLGNYENDRSSHDVYFRSQVWQQFPNKQFGASVGWKRKNADDAVQFQIAQSPFARSEQNTSGKTNLLGYSLKASWHRSWFQAQYSINLFEYLPGKYINYLMLGNKITAGPFDVELDFANRAASHQSFLFSDWSLVANCVVRLSQAVNALAKYSFDVNRIREQRDFFVPSGTEMYIVSAGVELFPRNQLRDLRAHALFGYTFGPSPSTSQQNREFTLNLGVTWKVDFWKMKTPGKD